MLGKQNKGGGVFRKRIERIPPGRLFKNIGSESPLRKKRKKLKLSSLSKAGKTRQTNLKTSFNGKKANIGTRGKAQCIKRSQTGEKRKNWRTQKKKKKKEKIKKKKKEESRLASNDTFDGR